MVAVFSIAVFAVDEARMMASITIDSVALAATEMFDIEINPVELLPAGACWLLLLAPFGRLITSNEEILLGKLSTTEIPDFAIPLVSIRSIVYLIFSPAWTLPPLRSVTDLDDVERSAETTE